jgi:hypothetical protein
MSRSWRAGLIVVELVLLTGPPLDGAAGARGARAQLDGGQRVEKDEPSDKAVPAIDPQGFDSFTEDAGLQQCFYCLFMRARGDVTNSERGAWIVSVNGVHRCESWPFSAEEREARPGGPPPFNAFEAVHTHPKRTEFSPQDYHFARVYHRPLYLVHRHGIWKYDPETNQVIRTAGSHWLDGFQGRKCECNGVFTDTNGLLASSAAGRP